MGQSMLSEEQKIHITNVINNNRFVISFFTSLIFSLLLGYLLHEWWVILPAGIIGGLFYVKMSRAILVGFLANGVAWILFLLYYAIFVPPSLYIADIFLSTAGLNGFGWLAIILTILIGAIGGGIGGSIGSAISAFIPWSEWQPKKTVSDKET